MTPGIIFSGERGVLVEQSRMIKRFRLIGIGLPPIGYRSNLAAYFEAIRTWVPWGIRVRSGPIIAESNRSLLRLDSQPFAFDPGH